MDDSTLKRHDRLRGLQRANLDSWRGLIPALNPASLDANIKKNTGFIKKCKTNLGQESAQLLREVKQLRLEKYASEIVPAVLEGVLKCKTASEYAAAIDVVSALHERFPAQFTVPLISQLLKALQPPNVTALGVMTAEQREREEQGRLGRQRVFLRLLGEMYAAGLLWAVDAQPGGAAGLDLAAAFALSHASAGAAGSKFIAKVREMVQQPGHCVLVGALQNLFLSDREHHLSIILAISFAKALRSDLGLSSDSATDGCVCNMVVGGVDTPAVTSEACRRIRSVLGDYLDSAIDRLRAMSRTLIKMRQNNEERLFNKGIIHADVKEKFERHSRAFEKLGDSVNMLCDALGAVQPYLEDAADGHDQLGIVFDGPATDAGKDSSAGLWEDDEERVFYESILDLKSKLPLSMLESGRQKQAADRIGSQTPAAENEAGDGSDNDSDDAKFEDIGDSAVDASTPNESADPDDGGADDDDGDGSRNALDMLEYQRFIAQRRGQESPTTSDSTDVETSATTVAASARTNGAGETETAGCQESTSSQTLPTEGALTIVQQTASGGATHTLAPLNFADVLRRLPTVTTRGAADQLAVDFCYVNNRANRRALVSALVDAPRRQMFVIPLYARVIATLNLYFSDIGEGVVDELSREFSWLARKRFKGLLDTRLKNARYLAELAKFRVAPLHVPFRCAKQLLEEFHAQNVEVLCALLDGCGRFLRAQAKTAERVEALLEVLLRKRRVMNLDDRTLLLIENACSACRLASGSRPVRPVKYRTPYEQYIRKLIYEDLSPSTAGTVCTRLRRLPWNEPDDVQRVRHALVSCFTKVWKIKHANVPQAAMVLAALGHAHPWFRVTVVDTVLENIKLGLEGNLFARSQRRIAEVLYVGEMFACQIVGTREIFDLVQLLLSFGHRERLPVPGRTCELDMASDYFRIRLACALLSSCGPRIRSAENMRQLYEIALWFQMYVLAKDQPLPVDIDYNVESLFETVFTGTARYEVWDDAAQALTALMQSTGTPVPTASVEASATPAGSELSPDQAAADSSSEYDGALESDGSVIDAEAEMAEAARQNAALEALLEQEEEDALERDFNQLMLDSSDAQRTERGALDVGIPMGLIGRAEQDVNDADSVRFALLTGKKQRPAVRQVSIPTASRMAQNLRQQEQSTMRERAQLKRIVLSYERREAEEERRQLLENARRPQVLGATFVNRPSAAASRRRQHVASAEPQKAQAYPGIPDHFL
ncbi:mRNA decay protein [Coemansia sp. RSA 2610]|nr:mRNA decay protein [Coemansia sp. RSA 2610]